MEIDVRRLTYLLAVVRNGSVQAAARTLGVTPSAVSQQISKLEQEAGTPILSRGPRRVTLTPTGGSS